MSLDTQDKRASSIFPALPWRNLWPQPNSAIDQGDRQQVAFVYRGISATEAAGALEAFVVAAQGYTAGAEAAQGYMAGAEQAKGV